MDQSANNGGVYGPLLGLITPMGNPCAEPEISILTGAALLTARVTSRSADSRTRLGDYIGAIGPALASFDQAPLTAAGFACTCYYLRGPEAEARDMAAHAERAGCPVITATEAIRAMCGALGLSRLALMAPYPAWLVDEAKRYFGAVGLEIVAHAGLPADLADTRGIYRLSPAAVADVAARLDHAGADAVLIGGTGMPSLPFVVAEQLGKPVFSSNMALASALLSAQMDEAGRAVGFRRILSPCARWRQRLALWRSD
ncbi:MAG: hypothetical protein NTZ14_00515 [Hyphomicrobiales bacterium]|nr:hypothetical protein [Hyphomicrobiales bacterium]